MIIERRVPGSNIPGEINDRVAELAYNGDDGNMAVLAGVAWLQWINANNRGLEIKRRRRAEMVARHLYNALRQIGRASCRERVESAVGAVAVKKKEETSERTEGRPSATW